MIPNLDFMRTMLNGIRESIFVRIKTVEDSLKSRIEGVDAKIHTPDYEAEVGAPGHILNKPQLIGSLGSGFHAEKFNDTEGNTANGDYSHAEGWCTTTQLSCSHAEGYRTKAVGLCSHAEGFATEASADEAHAEGYYTIAASGRQHAQGKYNVKDSANKYAHIVGNGSNGVARSNAYTLDWDGNAWFSGDVYVNSASGINRDEGSRKLVSSWEELPDKPFGSEGREKVYLNNVDFTGLSTVDSHSFTAESDVCDPFPVGETCKVVWNGAVYECEVQHLEGDDDYSVTALGDASRYPGMGALTGNGESFGLAHIAYSDGTSTLIVISNEQLTSVSVSVTQGDEIVTTIDPKYLPESVDAIVIRSSTAGSIKKFRVTVDDNGTLSAAEVAE